MPRFPHLLLPALLLAAAPVHPAGLPDTGLDICYNDTASDGVSASNAASIAGDAGTHPRQDCRYGRDAAAAAGALTKTGAGPKGLDYTKIANNGSALAAGTPLGTGATDWACTRDNITGLIWEIKSSTQTGLRSFAHTYAWYSTDAATNGGHAGGAEGRSTCGASLPGNLCNTQAYVTAVNAAALCTYTDWRVPTRGELLALYSGEVAGISLTYFPGTGTSGSWSASTYAPNPARAWDASLQDGTTFHIDKAQSVRSILLVRGE